jgi:hypothetical protein
MRDALKVMHLERVLAAALLAAFLAIAWVLDLPREPASHEPQRIPPAATETPTR